MIGFKVDKAKSFFFDRAKVIAAADRATLKNLSKMGAFVRRTARGSMRKAAMGKSVLNKQGNIVERAEGKPSKPGTPPKSRLGFLKDFLFFIYEPSSRSVVVGPALLNTRSGIVPNLMEFGGQVRADYTRTIKVIAGKDAKKKKNSVIKKGQILKYPARPYMAPALAKEAPKFANVWADTIKG